MRCQTNRKPLRPPHWGCKVIGTGWLLCRAIGKHTGRLIRQLSRTERRILASFTSPPPGAGSRNYAPVTPVMASAQTCPPIAAGERAFAEDEFVVVCVFCARMRSREGLWISLPLWLDRILRREPGRISHTYCPECLARHYPAHTESGRLRASCVEGKPAQAPLAIA